MKALSFNERIRAFSFLGEAMLCVAGKIAVRPETEYAVGRLSSATKAAGRANPWFDEENVRRALLGLGSVLTEDKLRQWLTDYPELMEKREEKKVGVIMAGNIPLVGFHDFLSVLISGNIFLGKVSSRDAGLHKLVAEILVTIEPAFKSQIHFVRDRITDADAVIATGSDNTARYFEYYYKNIPSIIRHNRNSLAVLNGTETEEELTGLAHDIFWYYGLGCRSISKLFVPEGYNLKRLFPYFRQHNKVSDLPAYRHNLDYQRIIFKMSSRPYLDAGNILLTEDTGLASPVSVLYYQTYKDIGYINNYVGTYVEKIQCIIGHNDSIPGTISFGTSQFPELWEYEDGMDTLKFLLTKKTNSKPQS